MRRLATLLPALVTVVLGLPPSASALSAALDGRRAVTGDPLRYDRVGVLKIGPWTPQHWRRSPAR